MHSVRLLRNDGGEMSDINKENSLFQFCVRIGDARSRVLECNTRAMCIVGLVEVVMV